MILQVIDRYFSICKTEKIPTGIAEHEFVFIGVTDREISVICEAHLVPEEVLTADHGWRCFRIAEDASFDKYGMIAFLADIISAEKTSTVVAATYDTDYLFVKEERFEQVIRALEEKGCTFVK